MTRENQHEDVDAHTGVETTGHEWDGIKELNNPLPRWWLYTFYATIVFSVAYVLVYPAIPLVTSNTKGAFNWSSRGDLAVELTAVEDARSGLALQLVETELEEVAANPDLFQFAVAGGESNFKVYCSQCHGSGAAGGGIYPNLLDDDWLWGGDLEAIYTTLRHGIRFEQDDDTRLSEMPAYGDGLLNREEISDVAWTVRQLSGQDFDAEAAERGASIFEENCAACHGELGEGVRELGAPRLADAIWLYGGEHEDIMAQVSKPKQGVMPAWGERLNDASVRQLAVYVHSLGGGE